MNKIYYKKGYKYQFHEDYKIETEINPPIDVSGADGYLFLDIDGTLTIKKGYAWDGPSGPAFDTRNFMKASGVHDALYQLFRKRLISEDYRRYADKLMIQICKDNGMSRIRCWWIYRGIRKFGGSAASYRNAKKVYEAP